MKYIQRINQAHLTEVYLTEALFQLLEVEFLIVYKKISVMKNKTSFLNLSFGTTSSWLIAESFWL